MAITLETNARNAACNGVVDLVDGGTGSPTSGTLEVKSGASTTVGVNEVANLEFANPAFGDAATGVATANGITSDTSAAGGTASNFTVFDSDGTAVFAGSVTATGGGGDLQLSSVAVGAGDTVSCSSFTVTMPAS